MKFEDINISRRRAIMIDPVSLSGWHQLTNSYAQARIERSGIPVDRLQFNPEFVKQNVEQSLTDFVGLMGRAHEIYDFVLTINRIPSNIYNVEYGGEVRDLYSFSQVPVVSWFVDNIGHHQPLLAERPLENEVILVADACNIGTLRDLGHDVSDNAFFPMWGAERPEDLPGQDERHIDVLFSGDIWSGETRDAFVTRVSEGDEVLRKIIEDTLEIMVDDKGETDTLRLVLDACSETDRNEQAISLFAEIDQWLRRRRRKQLLKRFESTRITVVGEVDDPEVTAQQNLEILGRKNIEETSALARQAKMFLGDFANFVNGVELRPSMAMANGAVFAGEENTYFKQSFSPDAYVGFSEVDGSLDDVVSEILASPEKLAEMDGKAGAAYMAHRQAKLSLS